MPHGRSAVAALVALALIAAPVTRAQVPAPREVVRLYPGLAPGPALTTAPESSEPAFGGPAVRNVVDPTLTVFRPAPGRAGGAAVIIAPGGGFRYLVIEREGNALARVLADHGVTAFVLKYRLDPTPANPRAAEAMVAAQDPDIMSMGVDARVAFYLATPGAREAMADGEAAVRLVRARAADFGLDPRHIGFIGFSAGGMIAAHLGVVDDPAARPDFLAAIYGALPPDAVVPLDAPPIFIAAASDDELIGPASLALYQAWRAADRDAELHVFHAGGHGFGMSPNGATSDHWIDDYLWWLRAEGIAVR
jgi:acetyl esterase/lipase